MQAGKGTETLAGIGAGRHSQAQAQSCTPPPYTLLPRLCYCTFMLMPPPPPRCTQGGWGDPHHAAGVGLPDAGCSDEEDLDESTEVEDDSGEEEVTSPGELVVVVVVVVVWGGGGGQVRGMGSFTRSARGYSGPQLGVIVAHSWGL